LSHRLRRTRFGGARSGRLAAPGLGKEPVDGDPQDDRRLALGEAGDYWSLNAIARSKVDLDPSNSSPVGRDDRHPLRETRVEWTGCRMNMP
jgi:hypothetical protein